MMENIRSCPICHYGPDKAKLFIENNIDRSLISRFSFASRKEPEFMCHRLVQCTNCDLVYADEPPDANELANEYYNAEYGSSQEATDAAETYFGAIKQTLDKLAQRQSVLEIGTGTGIFLGLLSQEGFTELIGVEPSSAAIAASPEYCRAWIREGIFEEKNYVPNSFDLVCCFMTMEHVHDPEVVSSAAFRLLRTGGAFVTVTHDYRSLVNRLLGKRSPIIDIEHMQLFSERSVRYLFSSTGFSDITVNALINNYSLQYWIRLAPLPRFIKTAMSSFMSFLGLGKVKVGVNCGNMIVTGFKRA
jgi:SAM-dependent methyltransferase